jgi:hypothetical protein
MAAKQCPRCLRSLPPAEFARDRTKASGHKSICKGCDRVKSRAYYARRGKPLSLGAHLRFSILCERCRRRALKRRPARFCSERCRKAAERQRAKDRQADKTSAGLVPARGGTSSPRRRGSAALRQSTETGGGDGWRAADDRTDPTHEGDDDGS